MKKLIIILGTLFLLSCESKLEREKRYNDAIIGIKIDKLKQVSRGINSPDFYIIDTNQNSYLIYSSDYVRLNKGDSLQINTMYTYTDIIEIY